MASALVSRGLTFSRPLTTALERGVVRGLTTTAQSGLIFQDPRITTAFPSKNRITRSTVSSVHKLSQILENTKNKKLQIQAIMILINIFKGHLNIADDFKTNNYRTLLLSTMGSEAIPYYEADHNIEAIEILNILLAYPGTVNRNIFMGIIKFTNDLNNGTLIPKIVNTGKTNAIEGNNFKNLARPTLFQVLQYCRDMRLLEAEPLIIGTNPQGALKRIYQPGQALEFMLEKRTYHANNCADVLRSWSLDTNRNLSDDFIQYFSNKVKNLNNNPNLRGGSFNSNKIIRDALIRSINKLLEIYISDTHFTYASFFNGTYKGNNPEPTPEQKENDADFSVFLLELSKKLSDPKLDVSKDLERFFSMFPEFESMGTIYKSELLKKPLNNFIEELRGGKHFKKTRKTSKGKKGKRYSRRR